MPYYLCRSKKETDCHRYYIERWQEIKDFSAGDEAGRLSDRCARLCNA